jgi:cytochrome P450
VGAVFSIPLGRQIAEWVNNIPNNGMLWFRGMLGAEYLIVAGAESLRDVLFARAYDFEKTSAFRRYTRRFMASGLVVQEGDAHKSRRKAISPAFQPKNVDALKPMLSKKSERLIQALHRRSNDKAGKDQGVNKTAGSTTIDICDWATRFALDVACVVGFGDDWGLVETAEVKPILAAYTTIFGGSKTKMSQYAWHNTAPQWLVQAFPHTLDKSMDEAAATIHRISKQAVAARISLINSGEKNIPQDFLTEVIQSGKFSPDEVSDELLILMAAAYVPSPSRIHTPH